MASSSSSNPVAADPRQVAEEHEKRRQLRQDYRSLIAETQKNREELISPDSNGLSETLRRADNLFTQVAKIKCSREAALDSGLMLLVSSLGKERAQKLHTDFNTFEPTEFAEKLITFMSDRRIRNDQGDRNAPFPKEGWSKLGQTAKSCFRRAPAFHFILGSFERGECPAKKKKQTANRQKEKDSGPAVVPKQLVSMEKSHQEVTTEEVERMLGILHQVTSFNQDDPSNVDPVSLFEFVINPHSFSQTVENIFHLSFLVKDGHAELKLDPDWLPIIIPKMPYMEGQTKERVDRKQIMMTLHMTQWKEIIEVFEIREPLIPTRAEPSEGVNGIQRGVEEMEIPNGQPQRKKKARGSRGPTKPSS
ncbi:non-structural maintenance of chromosomes element 4 homolog A-like isoform X1 [Asterias rubens]|uniref:non-structural maintenance of chromosomes element 4 homolog A-like isoform X1 n=1 Tax=Asterias rubens TaxID=7604 RepID=UPI0014559A1E|nr:non-structural maintenance of chromosomes element 4 homolog A-like isoform X1 [Asterias rubens]